ncbi:MAG: hypothetical protein WC455_17880 [Dehalococcoidia bacterium]|jgi:hypothetical protein
MKKTRWVLGVGYPAQATEDDTVIRMSKRCVEWPEDKDYIKVGNRIPFNALNGKDKYRLVLEKVEPKAAEVRHENP